MAHHIDDMIKVIASACPWYCHPRSTSITGDLPEVIDRNRVLWVHKHEEGVLSAVVSFKRACFSASGFLSWISTLVTLEDILQLEDIFFMCSLSLNMQAKTGVLCHLERDYHEANFPHLLEHSVPIHGIVTVTGTYSS
ncbi:hypothetical protein K438DRAFT_1963224 [Mycena galopus ATCC 62051]|nr:hypothetical protein K438DRAFT_1963224 [Mycena galopus ATCC 62051]